MKSLLPTFAIVLLSIGATACGGAEKNKSSAARPSSISAYASATTTTPSSTSSSQDFTKADGDKDNDIGAPSDDTNNNAVLYYGHAANASDTQMITALIKNYYAAAVAEDGAKACSMLYSTLEEAVPEDYGTSPPGPPFMKGTTCAAVMTLDFRHAHAQLTIKFSKLKVARVRLKEHHGLAVLNFGTMPEREVQVHREGHTWKMVSLLDSELP